MRLYNGWRAANAACGANYHTLVSCSPYTGVLRSSVSPHAKQVSGPLTMIILDTAVVLDNTATPWPSASCFAEAAEQMIFFVALWAFNFEYPNNLRVFYEFINWISNGC